RKAGAPGVGPQPPQGIGVPWCRIFARPEQTLRSAVFSGALRLIFRCDEVANITENLQIPAIANGLQFEEHRDF
ncbi:hypothetical protein, partial [Paracoccus litorisediminis]|uniref:hypothetical protein n=1 Tax=Paracoccus litorisediminis TaxID=2006130 RepID=UPI001B8BAF0D